MLLCHTKVCDKPCLRSQFLNTIYERCAFYVLVTELKDPFVGRSLILSVSGKEVPDSTLELVQIYFDTATFDEIQKDEKIKFDAQISLIGGTMGLLTGFSIISGVEIIFFLFRLILS